MPSRLPALAVLTLALLLAIAFWLPYTPDDVFITFRYGDHVARGFGPVWNVGERPVEGYTSLVGVLFAAASIALGAPPLLTAKALGVLASVATLAMLILQGRVRSTGERLVAGLLLLCSTDIAYYAASGMDNVWTVPLTTWLVLRHLDLESFTRKTYGAISLVLLALCLIRPEGHAIAIVVAAWHVWRLRTTSNRTGDIRLLVAPLLIVLVALHAARLAWFGDLLPNTYYAKHSGGGLLDTALAGVVYLGEQFVPQYGLMWVLAVFALVSEARASRAIWLCLLAVFPLYVLKVGGDDPDAFAGARLLLPILPVIWVYAARFVASLPVARPARAAAVVAIVLMVTPASIAWYVERGATLYQAGGLSAGLLSHVASVVTTNVRALVRPEPGELSRYLLRVVKPGEYVALPWAGRVPFETGLPTIDVLGLNDRHIARQPKRQRGIDVKYDADYVLGRRPRVICENVRVRGLRIQDLAAMSDAELKAIGAVKVGQRDLLRSQVLSAQYVIDVDAPADGCFRRIVD